LIVYKEYLEEYYQVVKKAKLVVLTVALIVFSVISVNRVWAAPKFPTFEEVQNMISTAIAPVQSAIDELTGRVEDLEGSPSGGKVLKVVIDSHEFGPVVNEQTGSFFYEPIQRFVIVNTFGDSNPRTVLGENIHLEFKSNDCTGTPYLAYFNDAQYETKIYNSVLNAGYNKHYISDRNSAPLTITMGSQQGFNYDMESFTCHDGGNIQKEVTPITQTTIPANEPLNLPFEFKYE